MIAEHKGEVPFVVYLLPLMAGICTGFYFSFPFIIAFTALAAFALAFVVSNIFHNNLKLYLHPWTGGVVIHLFLSVAGYVAVKQYDDRSRSDYFGQNKSALLLIRISNEPQLKGKYLHCTADVLQTGDRKHAIPATGKLLLTIMADSLHHLQYGDELLIPANQKSVDPPFNPATFNYKAYLARQNIYEQSFLYPGQHAITGHDHRNPIIAGSYRLRQYFVRQFKANIHDTTAAAIASTLILGYKADLSQDVLQTYSRTGTIHVLSVSGAHVAIVFLFISFLLSRLNGSRKGQWFKAIMSILLIWAYAMLTGFSPAVCRSALMISVLIIGNAGFRYTHPANSLALSAFILLFYNPFLLADVGFQLSYLAVLGLIMLQPIINNCLHFENKYAGRFWYCVSASLAAQLITFPLSAYYFHQFPVYFLISNLFIILPSEAILGIGLISLALASVPGLAVITKWVFWLLEKIILLMNYGLALIEHQPYAAVDRIWFTAAECGMLFIAIMLLFWFLHNRRVFYLRMGLLCFLILLVSLSYGKIISLQTNTITFYSLNKHAGILFKEGDEGVLLTDLRPDDPMYKFSVQPGIDSNRIEHLQIHQLQDGFDTSYIHKASGLIQFRDTRVMIVDPALQHLTLARPLKTNYLYLTGNPETSVAWLTKNYQFDTLIIDSSNSAQRIKKLVTEAIALKVNYLVLKRNKSLVVTSK